eukprot:c28315_g1_i1 orf=217-3141(+)
MPSHPILAQCGCDRILPPLDVCCSFAKCPAAFHSLAFGKSVQFSSNRVILFRGPCRKLHGVHRAVCADDPNPFSECCRTCNWRRRRILLSWAYDQVFPHRKSISAAVSVSTTTRLVQNEEEALRWRLDDKLDELVKLRDKLVEARNFEHRVELLDSNPSVTATFRNMGAVGMCTSPIVTLALEALEEYEIYLLKCLVAAGQDHVLRPTPAWIAQLDKDDNRIEHEEQDLLPSEHDIHSVHGKLVNHGSSAVLQFVKRSQVGFGAILSLYNLISANSIESLNRVSGGSSGGSINGELPRNDKLLERLLRRLKMLIKTLHEMESFYDSIGGIIGYQVVALELMKTSEAHSFCSVQGSKLRCMARVAPTNFLVPVGRDLSQDKEYALQAALWGLQGLPEMGEILPLGGSGDRLGLVDDLTGECLPVAMLPYCGRTLLEGHIRDLQAREYLHYKIFGEQHVTPVAIMTSAAKKNNERVMNLCKSQEWFGRGKANFCLFEQPLIPVVAAETGCWVISEPLTPVLKPGGHGVIWKLAHDRGIFKWFYMKGRKSAIVRQISNPIAATDVTLLALSGIGLRHEKKFGFASCERNVGTAEGVNVLMERRTEDGWEYGVTCVEYTEFSKHGIADVPVSPGSMQSQYPANTNVLYVNLPSVENIISTRGPVSLPGMILNLKKPLMFTDYLGAMHSVLAGRVECTMQNAADLLLNKYTARLSSIEHERLDTFVIFNQRRKVTSSAKRQRKLGDVSLHQTPEGSFLDMTRNFYELLSSCMVNMPEMDSNECYVESGPPFIALLHPGLGPLWHIVRQKISGGIIAKGSELQIDVTEFVWRNVELQGSLLIYAENAMGTLKSNDGETILHYGEGCSRCRLERVLIRNRGVDWACNENIYWQHKVRRFESLKIVLHGNAEFEAYDTRLEGSHTFEVPKGHRMCVTKSNTGFLCVLEPLPLKALAKGTWNWNYVVQDSGFVHLTLSELQEN